MNNQSIILTRGQLYEKVWSQSVSSLAKGIGISDVGLAKICIAQDRLKGVVKLKN